jgi:catechol 2,3-dioxygenase-like lactoylglutathione lyase family enzyme
MARSVGYVIVYVTDLATSIAFYRDVVGLALKFEDAGHAEFATEPARFALYEQRRAGRDASMRAVTTLRIRTCCAVCANRQELRPPTRPGRQA